MDRGPRNHDAGFSDDHERAGDDLDASWTEWHSRRRKLALGGSEPFDRMGEDTEDDDASEDEDDDAEHDGREPEDGF